MFEPKMVEGNQNLSEVICLVTVQLFVYFKGSFPQRHWRQRPRSSPTPLYHSSLDRFEPPHVHSVYFCPASLRAFVLKFDSLNLSCGDFCTLCPFPKPDPPTPHPRSLQTISWGSSQGQQLQLAGSEPPPPPPPRHLAQDAGQVSQSLHHLQRVFAQPESEESQGLLLSLEY